MSYERWLGGALVIAGGLLTWFVMWLGDVVRDTLRRRSKLKRRQW